MTVSVRYVVNDVDEAIAFYTERLGFELVMHPAPPFAILDRGELRLLLSAPNAGPGGGSRCPMAGDHTRAAGAASPSRSTTWSARSTGWLWPASLCAAT